MPVCRYRPSAWPTSFLVLFSGLVNPFAGATGPFRTLAGQFFDPEFSPLPGLVLANTLFDGHRSSFDAGSDFSTWGDLHEKQHFWGITGCRSRHFPFTELPPGGNCGLFHIEDILTGVFTRRYFSGHVMLV